MLKSISVTGLLALATLATAAPLTAQAPSPSAVTATELESAVLSPSTVHQAPVVGTTDAATRASVEERTRASDRDLAGGNTVVISTTAIIIILLILILVT